MGWRPRSAHWGCAAKPEARPMGSGKGAKPPSYNLQIAVDPDSHMIVHHDLTTDATDNRQLHPMAQAAKAVLDVETLQTIADAGYANASQAAACEAEQIIPAGAAPDQHPRRLLRPRCVRLRRRQRQPDLSGRPAAGAQRQQHTRRGASLSGGELQALSAEDILHHRTAALCLSACAS